MSTLPQINGTRYASLLVRTLPRPIRTEEENRRMTALLLELDEREDLSPEEEQLAEMLTILIEDFEAKHYPLPPAPPREALKSLMEERGLRHRDIWPVLGNKGVTSEILNGKRSISKTQAKKLAEFLHVPVDLFI
ncbi:MAG: transcriptional regulator [Acidobacteria bacterium]|nr:transcriptional regulator [Acidobacteriota bacterium]